MKKNSLKLLLVSVLSISFIGYMLQGISADEIATDEITDTETTEEMETTQTEVEVENPEKELDIEVDSQEVSNSENDVNLNPNTTQYSKKATLNSTTFLENDIEYTLDSNTLTATASKLMVTQKNNIVIPETITADDGNTYTVTKIGKNAFSGTYGFDSLPNTLLVIDENAFTGTITSPVVIPNSVTTIGGWAFAFTTIEGGLTIGSGVNNWGLTPFRNMKINGPLVLKEGLSNIYQEDQGVFELISFKGDLNIPGSIETIPSRAFMTISFEGDIILNEGTKKVGNSAFAGAAARDDDWKVILPAKERKLVLPNSLTTIESYAFSSCVGLTKIDHPKVAEMNSSLPTINVPPVPYPDVSDYESTIKYGKDDVMLQKSAKWTNDELTEAEIQIDYGRADVNSRLDVLFVVDSSYSMHKSLKTNYNGIEYLYPGSIVQDDTLRDGIDLVLSQNDNGYDNRVAVTGFSSITTFETDGFNDDAQIVKDQILDNDGTRNTDFTVALSKAQELIDNREDKSRTPIIIFMSDGMPNDGYGFEEVKHLREDGVRLYPLIFNNTDSRFIDFMKEMSFDKNTIFGGQDHEVFSDIFKDALEAAVIDSPTFSTEITDVLSKEFVLRNGKISDLEVPEGTTAKIENNKIIWQLNNCKSGKPYSLKIKIKLDKNSLGASGNLPTNELLSIPNDTISTKESPELLRYIVTHEFISRTEGKELPEEVLKKLPSITRGYRNNSVVYPSGFDTSDIIVEDGIWKFVSWDRKKDQITDNNVNFIGTWEFEKKDIISEVNPPKPNIPEKNIEPEKDKPVDMKSDNNTKKIDAINTVETGDKTNTQNLIMLLVLGLSTISIIYLVKRKNNISK